MRKNILNLLIVFIIGMAGGIFAQYVPWPFLNQNVSGPVYMTQEKKITTYVQENTALREAVSKVEKTVIAVKTKTADNELILGSGFVVTSDGLIVTLADLIPKGSSFYFFVDNKWPAFQILKRDLKNNLALVKVEESGLATSAFADLAKMQLGERVFLVAMDFSTTTPQKIVNEGIVSFFNESSIKTSILSQESASGSPLFDIEGNVVGLSAVAADGKVSAIPISFVKEFIGM
jgi:S1-C subfamily serine protease